MRGVIGAGLIILGLAGGYLILTGKFPPSTAVQPTTAASPTNTGQQGITGTGGIGITPHTTMGLPTMMNLADQTGTQTGGITA